MERIMKAYSQRQDHLPVIGRSIMMRRLTRIWHDLEAEQQWKYRELPPVTLFEMLKLNLLYADESELARAAWFWLRRPKTPLPKSLLFILLCAAAAPCLFMHMIGLMLFLHGVSAYLLRRLMTRCGLYIGGGSMKIVSTA
jgi:hypothetical protein